MHILIQCLLPPVATWSAGSRTVRLFFMGVALPLDLPAHLAVHTLCLALIMARMPAVCARTFLDNPLMEHRMGYLHSLVGLGLAVILPPSYPPCGRQCRCTAGLFFTHLLFGWLVPTYLVLRRHCPAVAAAAEAAAEAAAAARRQQAVQQQQAQQAGQAGQQQQAQQAQQAWQAWQQQAGQQVTSPQEAGLLGQHPSRQWETSGQRSDVRQVASRRAETSAAAVVQETSEPLLAARSSIPRFQSLGLPDPPAPGWQARGACWALDRLFLEGQGTPLQHRLSAWCILAVACWLLATLLALLIE